MDGEHVVGGHMFGIGWMDDLDLFGVGGWVFRLDGGTDG